MISITKLNGREMFLNPDLIESLEATPDTTISLTTGKKLVASDSIEDIIFRIIEFKRKIHSYEHLGIKK